MTLMSDMDAAASLEVRLAALGTLVALEYWSLSSEASLYSMVMTTLSQE